MAARRDREVRRGAREPVSAHQRRRRHHAPRRATQAMTCRAIAISAAMAVLSLAYGQRSPVETAWALIAKGQRAQAVVLLRDTIKAHPDDADARLLLGSILMEQGEQAESIAQLKEAARLRPKSAEAQNALGEA